MLEEISLDGVEIFHDDEKLILTGENDNIQKSLREAYELLVERFYNVSTRKHGVLPDEYVYLQERLDRF